jgi:hypothetical protein
LSARFGDDAGRSINSCGAALGDDRGVVGDGVGAIADLLEIRASDPYRELNPLAWRAATQPPAEG